MKALSLKQPWALWVVNGWKTLETRMWSTRYRGPVLIQASKAVDWDAVRMNAERPQPLPVHPMVTGMVIGAVDIIDCRAMTQADEPLALCPYEPGRFVFVCTRPRAVPHFAVRGQLGFFEVNYTEERHHDEASHAQDLRPAA